MNPKADALPNADEFHKKLDEILQAAYGQQVLQNQVYL